MISIRRTTLSCLAGLAILTNIQPVQAQTDEPDKACQTYFCMLSQQFSQEAICQPLISDVFNTFTEGNHTVGCGAPANLPTEMTVIHRKADKDFCRPDLKTDKGECRADAVIDFIGQNTLYTRQWKLKSEPPTTDTPATGTPASGTPASGTPATNTPTVTAPLTEYYEGKSVPNYTPEGTPPPPVKPTTPPPSTRPRT